MEFPHLGKQCALTTCKQLDFLPFKCDACSRIFCKDHYTYREHNCENAFKKDNQVPVCPLCNKPVPVPRGQQPDIKVGEHIDNDCQSDPAIQKRKAYTNKCSVKGCKQKELIKVRCESCRQNYCLKHRHEQDHKCTASAGAGGVVGSKKSAAATKAGQAAAARFQFKPKGSKPQQTSLSSFGSELDRERRERQLSQQRNATPIQQPALSEDEALALAIQASLSSEPTQQPSKPLTVQEQDDLALAQALAQSEKDEAERKRRVSSNDNR
ncbi:AN1-type zinc finger protein 2A isoform X2 [Nematostella vectensis]|uniref:AN1-type zinc finger protein 2A isoform X2 n=1 Tax=Nematostella vectensis TaxID=45351 RepID=UPI0020779864|nr:AN1-type zinc finger protein 2A isoform X2 [Nematostella vectensis]